MFVYLFLLVTGFLFLLLCEKRMKPKALPVGSSGNNRTYYKNERILPALFLLLLIFVGAFRYDVGRDYMSYVDIFEGVKGSRAGIGAQLLNTGCKAVGGTSQLMFFIVAVLTLSLFYKAMKMYSSEIMLSLFIFLCFGQMYLNTFNTIRQCFAAAVFMYSIQFIVKRKWKQYFLLILLACTFHVSAIVLIPLYWVLNKTWSWKTVLAMGAFFVLLPRLNLLQILTRADEYRIYEILNQIDTSFIDYLYLLISILIILYRKRLFCKSPYRTVFLNINYVFCFLTLAIILNGGSPEALLFLRLRYYFVFFYAIILQLIISGFRIDNNYWIVKYSTALFLSFLFIRTAIILGKEYDLLPYQFNFQLFNF